MKFNLILEIQIKKNSNFIFILIFLISIEKKVRQLEKKCRLFLGICLIFKIFYNLMSLQAKLIIKIPNDHRPASVNT